MERHYPDVLCPGSLGTMQKRIVEPLVIAEVAEVVSDPRVLALIREKIDRRLAAAKTDTAGDEARLRKEIRDARVQKENLVDAIASGVLTKEEAAPKMQRIRAAVQRAEGDLDRFRALRAVTEDVSRERERLVSLAADFAARARELKGVALRELLKPWLQRAAFHKETRELRLAVRRMPATLGPLGAHAGVPLGSEEGQNPLVVNRVILLPPAGAARGPRRHKTA